LSGNIFSGDIFISIYFFVLGHFIRGLYVRGLFVQGHFVLGHFIRGLFVQGHFVRDILSGDILSEYHPTHPILCEINFSFAFNYKLICSRPYFLIDFNFILLNQMPRITTRRFQRRVKKSLDVQRTAANIALTLGIVMGKISPNLRV